jgi:hypothetical protein
MPARSIAAALALIAGAASCVHGQDISSNLRGHWKLTDVSGAVAADSSSTPHAGTYLNGVSLASSSSVPVDGAVAAMFDGVNDYVAISTESYFDFTGPMTVAAWVRVSTFTKNFQAIVCKGDSAWRIAREGTTNVVQFACTGLTPLKVVSTTNINDGKWHHVVGVYTGSQLRIYTDGKLDASVFVSGTISTNNLAVDIGRNSQGSNREWHGGIYDVRVYHRALSTEDVAYLYLQGGPVGHWKLNAASGTTATDASIYTAHGALSGGGAWTSRCNGDRALSFNGSSQYVSIPSAEHLQPTEAITAAAWIHGDAWGSGDSVDAIIRKGEGNPNNYQLAVADGRVALILDGSDSGGVRGNTPLSTGRWYHVAATWDGAQVRIYVDGKLDNTPASHTSDLNVDSRPLYLGGRPSSDQFDGVIYDARLYNRALSPAEIAELAGLAGHWKFNEGSGTAAADSSGAGQPATLDGANWIADCAGNNALYTNGAGGVAHTTAPFKPPSTGVVAFWMQGAGAPGAVSRICGVGPDWEIRQQPDGEVVFDMGSDGATTVATPEPLSDSGRWYHVAVMFDADDDSYAIYVDGKLQNSGVYPNGINEQPADALSFGTRTGSNQYWQGALRDFRVYSRRLCGDEIADLAAAGAHWKLDETSGSLAADATGAARDAAVVGSAAWTSGTIDNAFQFNGSTSLVADGLMGAPRNVTIMGWANLTAADSGGAEIISLGDALAIRLDSGSQSRAFFYNGSSWISASTNQTFAGAGWLHVAATFDDDGNALKLYVNGLEAASTSTSQSIVYTGLGANTVIGRHGNGSTTFDFTGKIDDVRVYTRALCPEEILRIYNESGGGGYQGVRILKWVESR